MFCIPTVYIYEVWLENVTVKFPHFKLKINTKHVALLLIKKKKQKVNVTRMRKGCSHTGTTILYLNDCNLMKTVSIRLFVMFKCLFLLYLSIIFFLLPS